MRLFSARLCLLLVGAASWTLILTTSVVLGSPSQSVLTSSLSGDFTSTGKQVISKVLSRQAIRKIDARGKYKTWHRFTHSHFPRHVVRLQENVTLCDPNVQQYVGYLDVDEDKHFFFWFFESRSKPESDPLVLWLNGGPGCSSMTGLFMELGPCRVDEGGGDTTRNPYSWNNNANVIFLDQPANVGFSYSEGSDVSNSVDAAKDVYAFLQVFLAALPKFIHSEFHVTGESYAGHYIPAIGKVISDSNKEIAAAKKHDDEPEIISINLKSLAIGNGLTDPLVQYKYYPDMAADTKYGPVLPEETINAMRKKYPTCKALVQACYKTKQTLACVPAAIYCNNAMMNPFQQTGLNIYDIRMPCDTKANPLCYSIIQDIETYLNLEEVQAELGVEQQYEGCKMDINMKFMFAGDWMKPFVDNIPPLLEEGIRVLIYAGDADYICNWIGNKAWTRVLPWHGQKSFDAQKDHLVKSKLTGKVMGEARSFENFTFLRVYEAGHMVPYDQPEHALEMLNKWMFGKDI